MSFYNEGCRLGSPVQELWRISWNYHYLFHPCGGHGTMYESSVQYSHHYTPQIFQGHLRVDFRWLLSKPNEVGEDVHVLVESLSIVEEYRRKRFQTNLGIKHVQSLTLTGLLDGWQWPQNKNARDQVKFGAYMWTIFHRYRKYDIDWWSRKRK